MGFMTIIHLISCDNDSPIRVPKIGHPIIGCIDGVITFLSYKTVFSVNNFNKSTCIIDCSKSRYVKFSLACFVIRPTTSVLLHLIQVHCAKWGLDTKWEVAYLPSRILLRFDITFFWNSGVAKLDLTLFHSPLDQLKCENH